ncbi:hypothetical protein HYPBUDRAFT_104715 [Hyphopichia burtonii NRRL Y-1933]|uniref:DUF866-domain-containing protein n=1 Tax=Hyphopichia burtonii NRRL Y-1933 TaxID=984485 RepID=A0A1E4RNK0_9ASCO|nr:hypothetical protein HYPBUDRAFT_104715 [Hyphopichia burtonii NRRL Y-1933]ODV68833.1 hypothetical protein HYPBUDRAFT_104715 [Hyphopichia burtonii NRRL Y-1933]
MVKYYLKAAAELSNVTDLQPVDTPESPFEYTFKIECTKCREAHDKPVTINQFENHELPDSRGEASFIFRCHNCKSSHSALISRSKQLLVNQDEDSGVFSVALTTVLEIDARGVEFTEFIPEGRFQCKGLKSSTKFDEVDLEDGEWYDYDDQAGEEVSVIDVKWEISRS